jgi:hypothetical protein
MKIAKLEMKMIVAMFVIGYEYELVDSQGRRCDKLPVPNYNDIQQVRGSSQVRGCATADTTVFFLLARLDRRVTRVL